MKTKNLKTNINYILLTKLIYIILFLWFTVSILRTGFNFTKIIADKDYFSHSLREKRIKYFGINQLIFEKLKNIPNISKVLLLNENGTISYHYLRYSLYPTEFYNKIGDVRYDAIVVYNQPSGKSIIPQSFLNEFTKIENIKLNMHTSAYLYTK